jgi:prefoldin subunit 5
MKERLQHHLSDVGESFDYLRSDVRNLSRYMAELEELIEGYRAFAATVALSTIAERQARQKLLKKTLRVVGPPPDVPGQVDHEAKQAAPGDGMQGTLVHVGRNLQVIK